MKKTQAKYFQNKLLEEKEQIIKNLKYNKECTRELSKNGIGDIIDQANIQWELNMVGNFLEEDKCLMYLVNDSLRLIETGNYGICVECKNKINRKRLETIPWTHKCVHCALHTP